MAISLIETKGVAREPRVTLGKGVLLALSTPCPSPPSEDTKSYRDSPEGRSNRSHLRSLLGPAVWAHCSSLTLEIRGGPTTHHHLPAPAFSHRAGAAFSTAPPRGPQVAASVINMGASHTMTHNNSGILPTFPWPIHPWRTGPSLTCSHRHSAGQSDRPGASLICRSGPLAPPGVGILTWEQDLRVQCGQAVPSS